MRWPFQALQILCTSFSKMPYSRFGKIYIRARYDTRDDAKALPARSALEKGAPDPALE
jgi:hypothetical protein